MHCIGLPMKCLEVVSVLGDPSGHFYSPNIPVEAKAGIEVITDSVIMKKLDL